MPHEERKEPESRGLWKLGLLALVSVFWIVVRTGRKVSRINYPCQQAALTNVHLFVAAFQASFIGLFNSKRVLVPLTLVSLVATAAFIAPETLAIDSFDASAGGRVPLVLENHIAALQDNTSDLFYVQNATGYEGNMDDAVTELIAMMEAQGLSFYSTASNPFGLISSDDVILLKINIQWEYRGGTNTDLIRSVIDAIANHPDGFTGEIVVADNGQGLGILDYEHSNSWFQNVSTQEVVDSYDSVQVSTFRWDDLRGIEVDDYDLGDDVDGYVLSPSADPETGIYVNYPKFQTDFGTYLSFKNGIWDPISEEFDEDRLKVINMPTLKSHCIYGVTGCVKNYMGVVGGFTVGSESPHEHFRIADGGLGTMMAETRAPVLNIMDVTWVNAKPMEATRFCGPRSYYNDASFTDIIAASTDPVALDYWSSKNILIPTAIHLNYTEYNSLDPDYEPMSDAFWYGWDMLESFHFYLQRSMYEIGNASMQVTMNPDQMNVFTETVTGTTTLPPTIPTPTEPLAWEVPVLIVSGVAVVIVVAILLLKKRQ
jgi:hypothetical protein